jgi:hypothetical protein
VPQFIQIPLQGGQHNRFICTGFPGEIAIFEERYDRNIILFPQMLEDFAVVLKQLNQFFFQFLNPLHFQFRGYRGLGANLAKWRVDYSAMNIDEECEADTVSLKISPLCLLDYGEWA